MGRARSFAVLTMVALSGFLAMLDNTVVHVALPTIQGELGLSAEGLQWVAISYVLSFSSLLLLGGRLSDLVGRRPVLIWGLVIFTGASGVAALAGDGTELIAARAVQGVGAALVMPASLAVVAGDVPAHRRTFAIGVWTAALAVALASGPVVGGVVTQRWGWEWVFLLNVPGGALAALLAWAVPGPGARAPGGLRRMLDMPGVLLSGGALFLLTYGLVEGGEEGFRTQPVPALLAGAGVAGLAFLAVEARSRTPLVELGSFRVRSLSGGVVAQVLWGVGVNGVFFFTTLYLQGILDFSPTEAGLVFLPLAAALLATTPAAERLSGRLGPHRVIAAGLAMVGAGLLLVSLVGEGAGFLQLQPGLVLMGAGSAFTAPLTVASVAEVPDARVGMASGLVSTAREVSGVFGVALVGVVLARRQRTALAEGSTPDEAFLDGYAAGLRLAAALVLCGSLVALCTLRRLGRHRRPRRLWWRGPPTASAPRASAAERRKAPDSPTDRVSSVNSVAGPPVSATGASPPGPRSAPHHATVRGSP